MRLLVLALTLLLHETENADCCSVENGLSALLHLLLALTIDYSVTILSNQRTARIFVLPTKKTAKEID